MCETLLGQQYLSTFESNQTALKWNYNHSMMLDPGVQFLIFADQTLQQFNYTTEISRDEYKLRLDDGAESWQLWREGGVLRADGVEGRFQG